MATHEDFSRTHAVAVSSNRAFGWVFTAVFLLLGLWPWAFGGGPSVWALLVSALVALVTVISPAALALPNRLWLRFGLLLHRIVSPVVLGIMFYGVVTPVGALMRLAGKDNLRLRRSGRESSYWIERDPPGPAPDSLNNQF